MAEQLPYNQDLVNQAEISPDLEPFTLYIALWRQTHVGFGKAFVSTAKEQTR